MTKSNYLANWNGSGSATTIRYSVGKKQISQIDV